MPNLAQFQMTSNFDGEYLQKRMKIFKIGQVFDFLQFLPRSVKKSLANFGLTMEVYMKNHTYPNRLFLKDHILAHRGCCTAKFLQALENGSLTSAHPTENEGSFYNFFSKRGQKSALNSPNVCL